MGNEYLVRGHFLLGRSLFAEASAVAPRYAPAELGLARSFERTGDPVQAAMHYRRALEIEPANQDARASLASLLRQGY
jgi:Tfp pilus assembly protein PilF